MGFGFFMWFYWWFRVVGCYIPRPPLWVGVSPLSWGFIWPGGPVIWQGRRRVKWPLRAGLLVRNLVDYSKQGEHTVVELRGKCVEPTGTFLLILICVYSLYYCTWNAVCEYFVSRLAALWCCPTYWQNGIPSPYDRIYNFVGRFYTSTVFQKGKSNVFFGKCFGIRDQLSFHGHISRGDRKNEAFHCFNGATELESSVVVA